MSKSRILEGVFAIDKPPLITSAQVVRDLQKAFNPSKTFAPWMAAEKAKRTAATANQKSRRRKHKHLDVKIGHGGTLDPMATGVLIIGVGKGTKSLQSFLDCTKSYETTVLFGGATDTYDKTGKLLARAPHQHITRQKVEEALQSFKGSIMQKPPIYSALRIQGKRLYEYAREGKELPTEIQSRPVTVEEIEVVKWLEPGSHELTLPSEEAEQEEKTVAKKILRIGTPDMAADAAELGDTNKHGEKRKRDSAEDENRDPDTDARPPAKRQEGDPEKVQSNAIASSDTATKEPTDEPDGIVAKGVSSGEPQKSESLPGAVIRMTVTSGFYVRSLCHDLGKALGSLGCMATLVRSRQGGYELDKNTLPYSDLAKGEDEWGPKVVNMLEDWQQKQSEKS